MKIIFTILFSVCIIPYNSYAQTATVKGKDVEIERVPDGGYYYLINKRDTNTGSEWILDYELLFTNDGRTFDSIDLSTVCSFTKKGNPVTEMNILFVNRYLGFLYGNLTGYMFYPFLFRTEDAGKTWQRIKLNTAGTPFRKSDFFMFNETRGIQFNNWNSEPIIKYSLTSDGGKTWKNRTFKISRNDFRLLNAAPYLSEIYSTDGSVTLILTNPDEKTGKISKTAIIHSTDFGETFKEIK
jgi:hypothetical protein